MNCKLRALEPTDFPALLAAENDQKAYLVSDNYLPFSKSVLEKYLNGEHDLIKHQQYRYAIDVDDSCAGFVDLFDYNPVHSRAGVGIYVLPEFRKKTVASLALQSLIKIAETRLNIEYLHASVSDNNEASLKLFEKCGFQKIGSRSAWQKISGKRSGVSLFELVLA